jgi:acyl-CoA thioester hydrolase
LAAQNRIPTPRASFTFSFPLRVRWSEVDRQEIVFNPNYFVYADVAFSEYFRALGIPYPQGLEAIGSDLYAVSVEGAFHGSARYDDLLEIAYRTAVLGRTSMRFEVNVYRDGTLLFDGILVYVNADVRTREPVAIPAELIERINAFERTPPQTKAARSNASETNVS